MRPFCVPTAQLAVLLRLTSRRIQQLVAIGILPKPSKAGHDVCVAVPKYLEYVERPGESRTLSEARKKKVEVETKIKTLELRRREGELVLRAAVEKEVFDMVRRSRDTLQNIPPRWSGILAAETDQAKIFAILTKAIHDALEGLADGRTQDDRVPHSPADAGPVAGGPRPIQRGNSGRPCRHRRPD